MVSDHRHKVVAKIAKLLIHPINPVQRRRQLKVPVWSAWLS